MDEKDFLARRFETHRAHLRSVAYRMLGSLPEAEDAVQEAWLHASRAGADGVENLGGWLTTVLARVCLDQLRARASRREEPIESTRATPSDGADPEQEALLADSVGLALLVVLDRLPPAERLAFVLHDTCAMPFEDIAKVLGNSEDAARQLASRGRRRVQGEPLLDREGAAAQRALVASFLGRPGIIVAPRGRLALVIRFGLGDGRVHELDILADPAHLAELELAVIDN